MQPKKCRAKDKLPSRHGLFRLLVVPHYQPVIVVVMANLMCCIAFITALSTKFEFEPHR